MTQKLYLCQRRRLGGVLAVWGGQGRALDRGGAALWGRRLAKPRVTKYVIYVISHSCESMSTFPYTIPCY